MSTAVLPPALTQQLASLARRIRRLRAARGLSAVLLTAAVTAGLALLADASLELPSGVRVGFLITWAGLNSYVALVAFALPLLRPLRPEALAALIEEKYPDLGERLTSAVELAGGERVTGSPALIEILLQETETRCRPLDVLRAYSAQRSRMLSAVAAVAVLLTLSPALGWPGRYAELASRFFVPWDAAAESLYRFEVTPGNVYTALNRSATFTVRILPRDAQTALPKRCQMICDYGDGHEPAVLDLRADRADTFAYEMAAVVGDFTYHVEAEGSASESYRLTAIRPVELDAEETKVTFISPDYIKALETAQTPAVLDPTSFADRTVWQHGKVRFDLAFNRPAVAARLETQVLSEKPEKKQPKQVHPLTLSPDGMRATIEIPVAANTAILLVLEAEHDIRTQIGRTLHVQVDRPPAFLQAAAVERHDPNWKIEANATGTDFNPGKASGDELKVVPAYDSVPLDIAVEDDLAVERVELEYRVNDGVVTSETLPVQGVMTPRATARYDFKLAPKNLKEGDTVHYRLKASDNRRVPEVGLGPNVTYHPADRWRTLKIARRAEPLKQQEITAQRDDLDKRLETIKQDLLKEQRALYKLRQESREQETLRPEQAKDLKQVRQENRTGQNALRELARDAAETPGLQPVADRAQNVADREMHRSDEALSAAAKETKATPRDQRLQQADKELSAALQQLDELRKANDQAAQARLDQMKLETLAQRQQQLAEKTGEQAKEPAAAPKTDQAKEEQRDIAKDLQKLTEQSEPLRSALDATKADQAKQLAEQARKLAQAERELRRQGEQEPQGEMADLARKQQELAAKADKLARQTTPHAQAAKAAPLNPEGARKAAEALKQGNAGEAMPQQEKAARELDRTAAELDKAAEQARDPKEAAKQLARVQEAVRQQLKQQPNTDRKGPLNEAMRDLQQEQEAIRKAAQNLPVPEKDKPAREIQKQAADKANEAAKALAKPNAAEANTRMKEAREALERLAEKMPSDAKDAKPQAAQEKPQGLPNKQQAEEARQLAREQRELREAAQKLAKQQAEATQPQQEKQQQLAQETSGLMQKLEQMTQQLSRSPQAQQKMQQATQSGREARQQMQQAQEQQRQANQDRTQKHQQQAAQQLDQAAKCCEQGAQTLAAQQGSPSSQQTGESVQQAQGEMRQAQSQLSQNQPSAAKTAMERAAEALQKAAQQLAGQQGQQQGQPTLPAEAPQRGADGGGDPDLKTLPDALKQHVGKRWGELPGELQTKIIQDMKARYGDDYARIIKLYFEQLADTKKK